MASIQKRPDGKYRARYRDESGREHARHFEKKGDAQRWLDEQTAAIVSGLWVDPNAGKITFARYFEEWAGRQVWVAGTDRAMRLAVGSTPFLNVPLKNIRRSHVEKWVKDMATRLAPGTIRTRLNNVRAVLKAAVRDKVISVDPSEGVTIPRQRKAAAAMVLPNTMQVRAWLDSAEPFFRAFIALCAFGGLRLGEAAALRIGDINFLGQSLQVSRQVQRENGGTVEIRAPKYGSERTVYLAPGLVDILASHITAHRAGQPRDAWLFPGEGENPWHQNTVGYFWRKAKRLANVGDAKLHDLRHFYASGLIAQGCDVVTVQRALGHANPTVTLNTYSHLWPSAEDRTRKAAQQMLADTLADPFGDVADSVRTDPAESA